MLISVRMPGAMYWLFFVYSGGGCIGHVSARMKGRNGKHQVYRGIRAVFKKGRVSAITSLCSVRQDLRVALI